MRWLLGLIALILVGVGVLYQQGVLGEKSSSRKSEKKDADDDEEDSESSDDDDASESNDEDDVLSTDGGGLSPQVLDAEEIYSLGLAEDDEGGSFRLTLDGETDYVLFPQLDGRYWYGNGTLQLSETVASEPVQIKIGNEQKLVRLDALDMGTICYIYHVDEEQEEVILCE
jgi:hypothetical protein